MFLKNYFVCLIFLFFGFNVVAQLDTSYRSENTIGIALGRGYEDGWVNLTDLPSISIAYTQNLSKRVGLRGQISSFYRSMPDAYLYGDLNGNTLANLVVRDSETPFIDKVDLENITSVGIKDLNSSYTIKMLSIPIDVGLMFYPIQYKKHRIGVFLGASLTYESQNWWRDYYPVDITLQDGSSFESSFLAVNTEFNSFTPGECIKLEYSLDFSRFQAFFSASENNLLFSHASSIVFYNLSIGINAKL